MTRFAVKLNHQQFRELSDAFHSESPKQALSAQFVSPTHKRTDGRAPVWGSEFTTKVTHYRGDSEEIAAGPKFFIWDLTD